jgi:hypothetical protein
MAYNYAGGHSWDHLDGETCVKAADEIARLRAGDGYRAAWLDLIERCNILKEENYQLRHPPRCDVLTRDAVVEECAKICDKHAAWAEEKIEDDPQSIRSQLFATISNTANDCASLIRDLGASSLVPSAHSNSEVGK